MQANKKMDIHVTLGQQDELQFLTDVTTVLTTNQTLVQSFIQQSKFKQDIGEDSIIIFHFYVEPGKQKEGVEYFQYALNQDNNQQTMSPIQKPLQRPINKGVVDVVQTPGCIIIKYRFFTSEVFGDDVVMFDEKFGHYEKATLNSSISLKGQIRHNNKNRTNVKVDFVDYRIESDEITPSDLSKFLKDIQLNQDQLDYLNQVPLMNMLGNLKSAVFEVKMASFRQLKSYYNKANQDKFNKVDKPFPYENKGLFRSQVSFFGFYKNKIAVKANAFYNGEDVLMRLVKVYQVFLFKGLGI